MTRAAWQAWLALLQWEKIPLLTCPSWPKMLVVPDGSDRNLNPLAPAGGAWRAGDRRRICCRTQPAKVERYSRADRYRVLEVEQGVGDVEEVPDMEVARRHPRLALFQVGPHAVVPKRVRPEQAARVGMDPRVEVVNLGGEVCEVKLTSVEVQSNEPERPPVNGAILADIDALHKAHVGIEQERLDAAARIPGGPSSLYLGDADSALEIGYR